MKPLSLLLLLLGGIGILLAVTMDTTVVTASGGRVHNFGLMSDRQTYMILSGIVLIAGTIFYGFSATRQPTEGKSASFKWGWVTILVIAGAGWVAWFVQNAPARQVLEPSPPIAAKPTRPSSASRQFDMGMLTVKLSDAGDHYLQTSFVLDLASDADEVAVGLEINKIKNGLNTLLSGKTRKQVSGAPNIANLAVEIRDDINATLNGKGKVGEVFFTSIVTQ